MRGRGHAGAGQPLNFYTVNFLGMKVKLDILNSATCVPLGNPGETKITVMQGKKSRVDNSSDPMNFNYAPE